LHCSYGSRARELAGTENKYLELALADVHKNSFSNIQDIYSGLTEVHAMGQPKLDTEHTHARMDHNHIDPSTNGVFHFERFKDREKNGHSFPKRDPTNSPKLWQEKKLIQFLSHQTNHHTFSNSFFFFSDSSQATAMKN